MTLPRLERVLLLGRLKWWNDRLDKERKEHHLKYLFWETTHACNLRCRHCGSDCAGPMEGELSTEEIKGIFKSIAGDYDAKDVMVAVTGGEPFLRKDLFEVMGYASSLGFPWGVVTNGALVDEDIIEKCRKAGMKTVTVSVDGMNETHDFIRNSKGSFDKAIEALRKFKASGYFQVVQATTCVSQYNVHELPALYELFKDMGLDEWRLLTVNPIGRAKDDSKFQLRPPQLRSVLSFIMERRKHKGLRTTFEEEGFLGVEYEGKVRDGLFYCPAGVNVASVLADGSIAACPNLSREYIQGNVRKDRFKDIWENGYRVFRNLEWKRRGMCADCMWWSFCKGNSLHLWDLEAGKPVICHVQVLDSTANNR